MQHPTSHKKLVAWVDEICSICQPDGVERCHGSQEEWHRLTKLLVSVGKFKKLTPKLTPNSFLARSDLSKRIASWSDLID